MKTRYIFLFVFFPSIFFSQDLRFTGILPSISQTGNLVGKWNYNVFASTTIDAFDKTIGTTFYPATDLQLYVQPSIIYTYSSKLNFAGSYTYQRNNPWNNSFSNEHRLWQQLIYAIPFGKGKVSNRFRFEERFIQNRVTNTYPLYTRFRYQVGYSLPLQGKTLEKNEFYLNSYNEFYFTLTGNKNATYSENWTYVALGYMFDKMGKIEFGYLQQIAVRDAQKDLRFLDLIQFSWITNFKFK
jgi:hypothetical protein